MCKIKKQSYLWCCFVVMVQGCDSVGLSSYSHGGHQVSPQSVAFYGLQIAWKQIASISCGLYAVNPDPPTHPRSFSSTWRLCLCRSAHSLVSVLFLSLSSNPVLSCFPSHSIFCLIFLRFLFPLKCCAKWCPKLHHSLTLTRKPNGKITVGGFIS